MTTIQDNGFAAAVQHYESIKNQLIGQGENGRFAVVGPGSLEGVWDTYEDALQAAYQKFGLNSPFLVKRIDALEEVQLFTRAV